MYTYYIYYIRYIYIYYIGLKRDGFQTRSITRVVAITRLNKHGNVSGSRTDFITSTTCLFKHQYSVGCYARLLTPDFVVFQCRVALGRFFHLRAVSFFVRHDTATWQCTQQRTISVRGFFTENKQKKILFLNTDYIKHLVERKRIASVNMLYDRVENRLLSM